MGFLEVKDLKVHYPIRGGFFNTVQGYIKAVDGVSMDIEQGKTYGLIGESGSGKSTIGKAIVGLEKITAGHILYEGKDVTSRRYRKKINYNKDVQMIFQDSMSSLDPKKRILDIIAEPIRNFEKLTPKEEKDKVLKLLDIVGLNESAIYKYPFEFSGGQRQRIGVARAVACNPRLIVADEPVSALDLSVQAQVLNYMKLIQKEFNLSYIFISHDLGVVRHMCDYIYIMHNGKFVETGTREELYANPQHIYTKRLIAAIPQIEPEKRKELREARQSIEKQFDEQKNIYYDANGSVYDLVQFNGTHFVASRKEEK
ncbi:ATP-binding cassette domain-containing protein [uncultured Finegoldia sp.]|uniref:ATP-binding cassette domain-containing protein n=1 Tax=uncultured Finegoldia sp. TaxID=328009 RepID=UPI0026375087|nr:ATP-binding cassette domain-containing protein [uncultured Finegoldia sp.]